MSRLGQAMIGMCVGVFVCGPVWAQAVQVEGQPLAANVARLIAALQAGGRPLPESVIAPLQTAIAAADAARIQRLLDSRAIFVVQINPEARVKVARGAGSAVLQQHGWTPILLKIINHSQSTASLRILSPQSGASYGGVSKLSMQRQEQLELLVESKTLDPNRYLDLRMFAQQPMTARLSGLAVEYALATIYSDQSGKREATIGFDIGQGNQDPGFRGETPILFDIQPAYPVKLSIRDHDDKPTTARLVIHDQSGRVLPSQLRRAAPDFFFQPQIYRHDGEIVWLPPGEVTIQYSRGPEYILRKMTTLISGPAALQLKLDRWIDPASYGFYNGDHHIHAAGCAHYQSPAEGVDPQAMFRQVKGEGLNVGCVLTWGPGFDFQRRFFAAGVDAVSQPMTRLKYDLEISGFGSQALGHVCLLNLKDQSYPGSDNTATKGWPTWNTPVMRWARRQGGIAGYAHSASGMAINPKNAALRLIDRFDIDKSARIDPDEISRALLPETASKIDIDGDGRLNALELESSLERVADQLPNLAIPEMNGAGAMEIAVSAAEGVCDFISAMDTARIQEWNTWYHLLNCGLPVKVSGETDFPCMSGTRVGQGRVYVQLGKVDRVDFGAWCKGIAAGRSYVSDGFAHALKLEVNGVTPGGQAAMPAGELAIHATVAFALQTPIGAPYGTAPGIPPRLQGDTVLLHDHRGDQSIDGGRRKVEIVVNGHPAASQMVKADGQSHDLAFTVPIQRSSWVALRCFPQLHTNPIEVIVDGKPIRASRDSARWCQEMIRLLWDNRWKKISESERPEAKAAFDRAIEFYKKIEGESP